MGVSSLAFLDGIWADTVRAVLEEYGFTFVNHTKLNTVERFGPWLVTSTPIEPDELIWQVPNNPRFIHAVKR